MININESEHRFHINEANRMTTIKIPKMRCARVVLILILSFVPLKSFSFTLKCRTENGDIPFIVSNNYGDPVYGRVCVSCGGNFFRLTPEYAIPPGEENCQFYAANKSTVFPPYGHWNCNLFYFDDSYPDFPECIDTNVLDTNTFCLDNCPHDPSVKINIVADNNNNPVLDISGCISNWHGYCSGLVSSFLGDNPKQEKSKPDSDVFLFDGETGAEVTLRLEADPQEGNNGGQASLGISGNSLDESTSGTPPLEINATLPEDGEYSISVDQPRRPKDQRFRGSYILRVTPSTGSIDLIEPSNNVEK
jgi:hypothetical protein